MALRTYIYAYLRQRSADPAFAAQLERDKEEIMVNWLNSPLPDEFISEYLRELESLKA
jgi:hypothetical protein